MSEHTLSVVIPVGPGRTAGVALASLSEAGLSEKDEVLLVEDGGRADQSMQMPCSSRVITCKGNGANAARNQGGREAKGSWLCFLDDDDAYVPGALNSIRAWILAHPMERLLCLSGHMRSGTRPPRRGKRLTQEDLRRRNMAGSASCMVIRRDLFQDVGGYDEEMVAMQDWELWLRCAEVCSIPVLRVPLIVYDNRGTDRISSDPVRRVKGFEQLINRYASMWDPKTLAFHRARIAAEKFRAGLGSRKDIWHIKAPMISLYYLFKSFR